MNPTKEQLADPKWWNENAPVDATHYACADHTCRPLWVKDGYYSCADEAFVKWRKDHAPYMHGELISRPIAWNGEGLPPVGTVCELRVSADDWSKAHIKFASRNVVVWDWDGEPAVDGLCTSYAHAVEMRPLRTPEQIAEEERRSEFYKALDAVVLAMIDAGYRKQEQTK